MPEAWAQLANAIECEWIMQNPTKKSPGEVHLLAVELGTTSRTIHRWAHGARILGTCKLAITACFLRHGIIPPSM